MPWTDPGKKEEKWLMNKEETRKGKVRRMPRLKTQRLTFTLTV